MTRDGLPASPEACSSAASPWLRRGPWLLAALCWVQAVDAQEVRDERLQDLGERVVEVRTADWSALSHRPVEDGMKPVSAYLAEAMGEDVYTIAFTAHAGETRMVTTTQTRTIRPAPAGSLEDLLHGLGHEHAFLDFRALPADHWLRRPSTMAIREYMPERMDDWTRVVDAVFFIDRMQPPTRVESR